MPRGPAVYGVKWEKATKNGYKVQVLRDPELEDVIKIDIDIKRGIYQIVVLDGEDIVSLYHDFTLEGAVGKAKAIAAEVETDFGPAGHGRGGAEDLY